MRSRICVTVGCPSARLFVPPFDRSSWVWLVCCWAPCSRRYRSTAAGAICPIFTRCSMHVFYGRGSVSSGGVAIRYILPVYGWRQIIGHFEACMLVYRCLQRVTPLRRLAQATSPLRRIGCVTAIGATQPRLKTWERTFGWVVGDFLSLSPSSPPRDLPPVSRYCSTPVSPIPFPALLSVSPKI